MFQKLAYAGTFFAVSLISIRSLHFSSSAIMRISGIILGKSSLGFFPGSLLQALLFRHGGLTALGAIHLCYPYRPIIIFTV